jgi:hypothetical protein
VVGVGRGEEPLAEKTFEQTPTQGKGAHGRDTAAHLGHHGRDTAAIPPDGVARRRRGDG